ncbi:MAG: hypothetical protein U0640_05105 [Phycisphaerales bacterium]
MSSIITGLLSNAPERKGNTDQKSGFVTELKLLAASIRAAWQPKSEQEPVDSFMRY